MSELGTSTSILPTPNSYFWNGLLYSSADSTGSVVGCSEPPAGSTVIAIVSPFFTGVVTEAAVSVPEQPTEKQREIG